MRRIFHFFCAFVFLTFLVGCGNGHVPLSGKVTFRDTGEPLTRGAISFVKDGKISVGTIQPDGTYTVETVVGDKGVAGLPPGRYEVRVTGAEEAIPVPGSAEGTFTYLPLIDPKFEDVTTSGLDVTVDASTKEYNFTVDRFAGAGRR